MQAFKQGELHLLIATTVIEVGVDVPNASLMIIENPERLGWRSCTSSEDASGAARSLPTACYSINHRCQNGAETPAGSARQQRRFRYCPERRKSAAPASYSVPDKPAPPSLKSPIAARSGDDPDVQRIARHIHERYSQQAQALIERWMPETERYSNV